MFKILKIFSNQCEFADKCPFYQKLGCDNYYSSGIRCGIEREKNEGSTWEEINKTHTKRKIES